MITKETRECVLGKYGKLPAEIDEGLFTKVADGEKVIDCRPADLLQPEWEGVIEELDEKSKEPITSEEDRLTYALFPQVALKFFETRNQPVQEKAAQAPAKPGATAQTQPVAASSPRCGSCKRASGLQRESQR